MPDLVLRDASGDPQTYPDVETVEIPTTEDGVTAVFTAGEVLDGVEIALDFSGGDQTVSVPDGYLVKQAVVKMPETLLPNNIAEGTVIAGIAGTVSRGKIPDDEKAIKFYDPYGNIFCAYTRAEIQELTELPPGPELTGVTFEKWTHTLEELKETLYYADVGPMYLYDGTSATILIIEPEYTNAVMYLYLGRDSGSLNAMIYWGDGSSTQASQSVNYGNYSHIYAEAGEYVIAVVAKTGHVMLGSYYMSGSYHYCYGVTGSNCNSGGYNSGYNNTTATDVSANRYLKSILCGSLVYNNQYMGVISLMGCSRLRFVSLPPQAIERYKAMIGCGGLRVLAGKYNLTMCDLGFYGCPSIRRLRVGSANYSNQLKGCDVEEVEYLSNVKTTKMNVQWAMLMHQETPPTLGSTTREWGTKPIYVPDAAVEAYKAADGWSTVAEYIVPASTYRQ